MRKAVIYRPRQKHVAEDHNNLQDFVRDTFDDLTRDAVTDDKKYSGFAVTQTSTTEIAVAPGRLYDSGRQHINESVTAFSLLSRLPLATKRKVAVVAFAATVDTDVQARDFLINVVTRETEPQAVAMERLRRSNLDIVNGVEGPDPQAPTVSAETLVIALVTLGTTGILSIEMVAANRLENVEALSGRVTQLDNWRAAAGTRLETLASDLSGLANRQTDSAQATLLEHLLFDVARVRRAIELPSTYTGYGADMLHTTEQSATGTAGYSARIEEGLTFAPDAQDIRLMSLFNPYDANIITHGSGLVLPAYEHAKRIEVQGNSGSRSLTEYPVTTWALVKKTFSRIRTRWGNRYKDISFNTATTVLRRTTAGPNGEPPDSKYPIEPILYKLSGEAGTVFKTEIKTTGRTTFSNRRRYIRQTAYTEPYWSHITEAVAVDGALRAQSFLNAQDGWMTRIGLYFTQLAASGDIKVAVCELTDGGTPDRESVIAEVTLARAAMQLYPAETTVDIGPAFLRAGRRYAIVLLSQAAHHVAMGDPLAYSGGAFFHSIDGAYFSGDQTEDMKFAVYYARFIRTWLQVQLSPLSLSGGISDIDLINTGWVPEATGLQFEVQASGGQWTAIDELPPDATSGPLAALPPLLNFRAILSGTPDVMPGIDLSKTQQELTRPKVTFTHFATQVTLPAASSTIKVKTILAGYVEANHDLTVTLLCGPAGATVETADTVVDKAIEGGLIERLSTFNTAAAQTQFTIKMAGGTVAATDTFVVQERSYVAL